MGRDPMRVSAEPAAIDLMRSLADGNDLIRKFQFSRERPPGGAIWIDFAFQNEDDCVCT
jgi:hypothetical protein